MPTEIQVPGGNVGAHGILGAHVYTPLLNYFDKNALSLSLPPGNPLFFYLGFFSSGYSLFFCCSWVVLFFIVGFFFLVLFYLLRERERDRIGIGIGIDR